MPYIKQEEREVLADKIFPLLCTRIKTPGNLNYLITKLCHSYISEFCEYESDINYKTLNEVIGVLESAKLELYRTQVAPYEDKKIEENGNVEVY